MRKGHAPNGADDRRDTGPHSPGEDNHTRPRPATIHELKCWPAFFALVWDGKKPWELRRLDRDFRVGDFIRLLEWDPETGCYTTAEIQGLRITAVLSGHPLSEFGLKDGYGILSLDDCTARRVKPRSCGTSSGG